MEEKRMKAEVPEEAVCNSQTETMANRARRPRGLVETQAGQSQAVLARDAEAPLSLQLRHCSWKGSGEEQVGGHSNEPERKEGK